MNNTLIFDGKSTYVEVPLAAPTNDGGAITVEFWNYVKSDEVQNSIAFMFADKDGKAQSRTLCHAPWGDKNLYWDCGGHDWSLKGRLSTGYTPYLNKWTHIALVSAGTKGSSQYQAIYINGELIVQHETSPAVTDSLTRLLIGGPSDDTKIFHEGLIDEFRVWNRVRTKDEIKRDMYAQMIGDEPGLVACFNFNWGFQDYAGDNFWGEKLNTLPNSVSGGPAGKLHNFSTSSWAASGLSLKAPVGPIYRLKSQDGTKHFHTAKLTEKEDFKQKGGWQDDGIAFYAHRAAAPGTQPLYRFHNKTTGQYLITIDPAERQKLDPRILVNDPTGDWVDDEEIAFVSATMNGQAVPLYTSSDNYRYTKDAGELAGRDTDPSIACYVLPTPDSAYDPKPVAFMDNGLSEHLWYALVCRSYKDDWGMQVVLKDGTDKPVMGQIPATGEIEQFQWRLLGNRLINRDTGLVLTISGGFVKTDYYNQSQPLSFTPVPSKGTDCFTLVQGGKALSCKNGELMTVSAGNTGESEQWTLLAMEPVYGYTIPAPPASHAALPFSKYFEASGVHILGTGTVSDWAMLRVKLIVENMLHAVKDSASIAKMKDKEVFVVSRDDSAAELAQAPCIGMAYDEGYIGTYRGGAGRVETASFCFLSEELMWKHGVFNSPPNTDFRKFDQVVHEFAHVMDNILGFDGEHFPKAPTDNVRNREVIAGKIQSWFKSIGTPIPNSHYYPATRNELQTGFKEQYDRLANYFDPDNTWTPPVEFRTSPSIPQSITYLVAIGGADFTFEKDKEYYGIPGGGHFLRFQSDGNFVIYDGTPKATWVADPNKTWAKGKSAAFKADGDLAIYDGSGKLLWNTNTGGNPGAMLHLSDQGELYITDKKQETKLWSSAQAGD